jgi:histidinol-phosphate aminotransferase
VTDPYVLDFSANLNPFGPAPSVLRAVHECRWDVYPDPDATVLSRLLAERHGIEARQVLVGNGCSELIDLVCRTFVRSGDRVSIVGPTYGEYVRSARLCGAVCRTISGLRPDDARVVFLCNPNNPTGAVIPGAEIVALARAVPDTLVVADEAYADCVPGFTSVITPGLPNSLVLRSLTKAHGLAGLRVGYAVGPPDVIEALRRTRVPWGVSAVAQTAAAAAVRDDAHTRSTVSDWLGLRDELVARLHGLGLSPAVAATPFFLLPNPTGDPWHVRLARHGIAVRDCSSFGLPGVVRVSPRFGADNARLVAAVRVEVEQS